MEWENLCDFGYVAGIERVFTGSCMEYLILRGAMAYDPSKNAWVGPTQKAGYTVKMEAMKETQNNMFENSIRSVTHLFIFAPIASSSQRPTCPISAAEFKKPPCRRRLFARRTRYELVHRRGYV